jgi:hypothetical protein
MIRASSLQINPLTLIRREKQVSPLLSFSIIKNRNIKPSKWIETKENKKKKGKKIGGKGN